MDEYNKYDIPKIIHDETQTFGIQYQLSRTMEEIAELIEQIMKFKTNGFVDKLPIIEEIIDCIYMTFVLRDIYTTTTGHPYIPSSDDILESHIKNPDILSNIILDNCIQNLSIIIQKISKISRGKYALEEEIHDILAMIFGNIKIISEIFNIKLPKNLYLNYELYQDLFQFKILEYDELCGGELLLLKLQRSKTRVGKDEIDKSE